MSGSDSRVTRSLLLAGAAAAAMVAYLPPLTRLATSGPSNCLVNRTTGLRCPVCGMTRSVVSLLHGHPIEAFLLNPLVYLAVGYLGWALWSMRPASVGGDPRAKRPRRQVAPAVLGAALAVSVVRNLY